MFRAALSASVQVSSASRKISALIIAASKSSEVAPARIQSLRSANCEGVFALLTAHFVCAQTSFAHYRELVKPKEAKRYWNIKPVKTSKVVQMVAR
jgi:hypothetical protein